jgi:hypothetical protein
LLDAILVEHAKPTEVPPEVAALVSTPDAMDVTVILDDPAVVNPVAVNVPVPAVVMVIVAVLPVCEGELVL